MAASPRHRTVSSIATRAALVGASVVLALLAIPVAAPAVSRTGSSRAAGRASSHGSSICGKVSATSVSALVGYKVPAGVEETINIKPTKTNYETSGTNIICTYGTSDSMAAILKDVSLTFEVTSKPVTAAELQHSLASVSKLAKYKFAAYSGLGVPAFYFSLTEAGITGQGISGEQNSTHFFGASVESKTISKSSLAGLAKLAEKL